MGLRMTSIGLWLLCMYLLSVTVLVQAEDKPPYALQPVADGFTFPTAIVQLPQDTTRLFIADLSGKVSIVKQGELLPTPFLDLSKEITAVAEGAGLHDIVFHPDYAKNGFFFVVYTLPDRDEILVRYQVSKNNPDVADPASAHLIMKIQHLTQ